ncbi:MAG: hypothetical protein L0207_07080 [Chlamydiae bacterium]|nr:hypothetical protein [Chlamydiota bacterium]
MNIPNILLYSTPPISLYKLFMDSREILGKIREIQLLNNSSTLDPSKVEALRETFDKFHLNTSLAVFVQFAATLWLLRNTPKNEEREYTFMENVGLFFASSMIATSILYLTMYGITVNKLDNLNIRGIWPLI